MKKQTTKKTAPKTCCGSSKDKMYEELHKMGDELMSLAKNAKTKYKNADPATKKKIITGVAGATTLIAGAIGLRKITKKKK